MSAARCRRRYCGYLLDLDTDGSGKVVECCAACDRNRRGLCRDCPRQLEDPHAMRCRTCAWARTRARGAERDRERYPQRRTAQLAYNKRRVAIPAIREHRRRYMQEYRRTYPRHACDREYQRAYMAARRADPAYRRRQNARRRELRRLAKVRAA